MSQDWALAGLEAEAGAERIRRAQFDRSLVVMIAGFDAETGCTEVALHPDFVATQPADRVIFILRDAVAKLQREIQIRAMPDAAVAVRAVCAFIGEHGESRFQALGEHCSPRAIRASNRVGWRKRENGGDWRYLIEPEFFRQEVVAGMDPEEAARALYNAGFLVSGEDGRLQRKERVGLPFPVRVYAVSGTILQQAAA
jgi:hypothetical protein